MSFTAPLRLISRSSPLAQIQVEEALTALASFWDSRSGSNKNVPDVEVRLAPSFGDQDKSISLLDGRAPPDLFTRELDRALLSGDADFAVHSAKDLPVPLPEGLRLLALLPARNQTDSLACRRDWGKIDFPGGIPSGSSVGTSSPLRRAELLRLRPDLKVVAVRGAIEERLALVDEGRIDALIVATCALERLGLSDRISAVLPFATHPLQGHLAVTGPSRRGDLRALWAHLDIRRKWGRVVFSDHEEAPPWNTVLVQEAFPANREQAYSVARNGGNVVRRVDAAFRDEVAAEELQYWAERLVEVESRFGSLDRGRGAYRNGEPRPRTWYTGTDASHFWRRDGVLHLPLIRLEPFEDPAVDRALRSLERFDWMVFTSRPAVRFTFDRLFAGRADEDAVRMPAKIRLAAVGRATAAELKKYGLEADLVASQEDAEGLAKELSKVGVSGRKIFFPCSDLASAALQNGLTGAGFVVERTTMYTNERIAERPSVDWDFLDEIVVASPSCARALHGWFPSPPETVLMTPMGRPTARALEEVYPGRRFGPCVLEEVSHE